MCTDGYGAGADNTCHACTDVKAGWLKFAGAVFVMVALLSLVVAVAFLVGGLDAVDQLRRRSLPRAKKARSVVGLAPPVRESGLPVRKSSVSSTRSSGRDLLVEEDPGVAAPSAVAAAAAKRRAHGVTPTDHSPDDSFSRMESSQQPPKAAAGAAAAAATATAAPQQDGDSAAPWGCCGLGGKMKRWASRVPLNKVKILLVVWQILTVFPSVSSVDFPPLYSRFLSSIDFVNFDIGSVFSASCLLPGVSFYHRLLLTTLAPLVLALVLVLTYHMAKRRAGTGPESVLAKKVAWSRHLAAGLLLTFLVRSRLLLCRRGSQVVALFLRHDVAVLLTV